MSLQDSSSVSDSRSIPRGEWRDLVWAVAAAFGCYFCMYAFRKPFTAAGYAESTVWGLSFKVVLVTSQILGYMLSKFLGIKVIAELPRERRAGWILKLVVASEVALLMFAVLPRPWNALALFLNGLPLGMVFGLVLGFLEGRRMTEALTAGLCTSFILADGATRSVGAWLLERGISEEWMPAIAGLLFLPPLALFTAMLSRVTPPTTQDIQARTERLPMRRVDRYSFVTRYAGGLVPLVIFYLLITILRSLRGDFSPELWRDLGNPAVPSIFAQTESWIALAVLVVNGSAVLIQNNRRAFLGSLVLCGLGVATIGAALAAHHAGHLNAYWFMILLGLGLYIPYVAMHTTVFERLLAVTRERANLGFLMYLVDSFGYLGFVGLMLAKNVGLARQGVLGLVRQVGWITCAAGGLCLIVSLVYFAVVTQRQQNNRNSDSNSDSKVPT